MLRVTTGCVTCRIRRVKCDEEKPTCRRCKTSGRKCQGYVNAPLSRKGLGPTVNARVKDQTSRKPGSVMLLTLNDVTFENVRDAQCFDFFRTCSIPTTNLLVTDNFWSHVILQAIPAELSIKHGILALGSLHRHFENGQQCDYDYAIEHYGKAMRIMANSISGPNTDTNIVLMTMIIFHCFENHVQNFNGAGQHLRAGLRLLRESKRPPRRKAHPARSATVIDEITRTLHRLDVHHLTFSDRSAPYEWPETIDGFEDTALPPQLASIEQGRDILMTLFKRSSHLAAAELAHNMGVSHKDSPQVLAHRRLSVAGDLAGWKHLMLDALSRPECVALYTTPHSFILFETYYTCASMNLAVSARGMETCWDQYVPQCSHMVKNLAKLFGTRHPDTSYAANKHVTYDLGIIAPLFWIAIKCRHPLVRREAIAILSSCYRREGKWSSIGAALVAQLVVDVEEEVLGTVLKPSDITESQRVHLIEPRVNPGRRAVELHLWRRSEENGKWAPVIHTLDLGS